MENILPIESIQERDIDLLLLEEFNVNIAFCEWIIQKLELPNLTIKDGAWRSVSSHELGETDILFSYNSSSKKIFVLIENKLDAPFQPDQFERYLTRGERFISNGNCDDFFCFLIAPEKYCDLSRNKFKYFSYEAIRGWYQDTQTERGKFKQKLFEIAIEKQRRGRTLSAFCSEYWQYFSNHLQMNQYKIPQKSNASNQAQFYPLELPKFNIYHLFEKGVISISIEKKAFK